MTMGEKMMKAAVVLNLSVFSFGIANAQYPTIPDSVKVRGAQEEAQWDALNEQAWKNAMPAVIDGMFKGKPFVPQSNEPTDLKDRKSVV